MRPQDFWRKIDRENRERWERLKKIEPRPIHFQYQELECFLCSAKSGVGTIHKEWVDCRKCLEVLEKLKQLEVMMDLTHIRYPDGKRFGCKIEQKLTPAEIAKLKSTVWIGPKVTCQGCLKEIELNSGSECVEIVDCPAHCGGGHHNCGGGCEDTGKIRKGRNPFLPKEEEVKKE